MNLTKRSKILGVPVGPRHADPVGVAMLAGLGLTAAAGSFSVVRITRHLLSVVGTVRTTLDKVGRAAEQAAAVGERVVEPLEIVNAVTREAI